ncbi:MAG: molybdopterin-guanine dinucleotide biosynthesis protein B [Methanomicrobia archaeon]|nr:molybdopterin-guanine dinucleotide biosynthesis protein B [Methanomicrobia archaeon]
MKVVAIVGKKKSGKTALIAQLIPYLKEYGNVGCIKHAHELDLDTPIVRDTDRFVTAGAEVVIGASEDGTMKLYGRKALTDLIAEMAESGVDFVLVEGFKSSDLPKIALNNFSADEVGNIITHVDSGGDAELQEKRINELVQLILALDDY